MCDNLLEDVLKFYKNNDWKSIIELNKESNVLDAQKLLWVWPSELNLVFIDKILCDYNVDGIISIGCGCGLLEWIINAYTRKPVMGYEVNKEWWESKYSNPTFIDLQYPRVPLEENLNERYALLFCYFNNGPAFLDYVRHYDGNVIFIIGPGNGRGTHTNPQPFAPGFLQCERWTLHKSIEVKDTKDFIAVYVKKCVN